MTARELAIVVGRAGAVYVLLGAVSRLTWLLAIGATGADSWWLLSSLLSGSLGGMVFEFGLATVLWVSPEWLAPPSSVPDESPPVAGDLGTAVVRAVSVGFLISALAPALAYLAVAGTPPELGPTAWVGLGVTILQCLLALIGVVYAPEIARWRLRR